MLIGRLCLTLLALNLAACASSHAASAPSSEMIVASNDLHECTELVRDLVRETIDLTAAMDISAVGDSARANICKQRIEVAEKRASQNEWLARWGLPLGGLGGATVAAVVAALLFTFVGR